MSTLEIKNTPLYNKIVAELDEDCNRFTDGAIDELSNWEEQVLSCPSADMIPLLAEVPEEEADIWFELIDDEIKRVVHNYIVAADQGDDDE